MMNMGLVIALIKKLAPVAPPEVITQAVNDYLDEHPEIEIADGSVTEEKLAADVALTLSTLESDVSDVKTAIQGKADIESTDAENVDLDVTDENGNVLARFEEGHIKTKKFDSSNLKSMVTVESKDADSDDDLDFVDSAGNVLIAIKKGHIKTKRFNSVNFNPNIVKVKADGSGDYANIRLAVESIIDADAINNPYIIEIYEGTYDILSYYDQEEIEDQNFVGLMLSDGMYLKGIGNRDNIILYGYLDTSTYTQENRNNIATLNTVGECGIDNVTVIGENIRYAVHDDFMDSFRAINGRNPLRTLINSVFIGINTTGSASYGAGTSKARDYFIHNCLFPTEVFGIHMQNGMQHSCQMICDGCEGVGVSLGDYSASATEPKHTFLMNDCCFKSIGIYKHNNGSYAGQHMIVLGTGNHKSFVSVPDGFVYQTADVETAQVQLQIGDVVTADYGTANAGTAYGVCIGSYDGTSYIQKDGYILASLLGLTVNDGDYIGVTSGSVDIVATQADSIGKVISFNNKKYIKLTI